nr:MAG TPA: hypothetical protein [Bacteriophage sp.]
MQLQARGARHVIEHHASLIRWQAVGYLGHALRERKRDGHIDLSVHLRGLLSIEQARRFHHQLQELKCVLILQKPLVGISKHFLQEGLGQRHGPVSGPGLAALLFALRQALLEQELEMGHEQNGLERFWSQSVLSVDGRQVDGTVGGLHNRQVACQRRPTELGTNDVIHARLTYEKEEACASSLGFDTTSKTAHPRLFNVGSRGAVNLARNHNGRELSSKPLQLREARKPLLHGQDHGPGHGLFHSVFQQPRRRRIRFYELVSIQPNPLIDLAIRSHTLHLRVRPGLTHRLRRRLLLLGLSRILRLRSARQRFEQSTAPLPVGRLLAFSISEDTTQSAVQEVLGGLPVGDSSRFLEVVSHFLEAQGMDIGRFRRPVVVQTEAFEQTGRTDLIAVHGSGDFHIHDSQIEVLVLTLPRKFHLGAAHVENTRASEVRHHAHGIRRVILQIPSGTIPFDNLRKQGFARHKYISPYRLLQARPKHGSQRMDHLTMYVRSRRMFFEHAHEFLGFHLDEADHILPFQVGLPGVRRIHAHGDGGFHHPFQLLFELSARAHQTGSRISHVRMLRFHTLQLGELLRKHDLPHMDVLGVERRHTHPVSTAIIPVDLGLKGRPVPAFRHRVVLLVSPISATDETNHAPHRLSTALMGRRGHTTESNSTHITSPSHLKGRCVFRAHRLTHFVSA